MFTLGIQGGYLAAALLFSPAPPSQPICVRYDVPPTPVCGSILDVDVGQLLTFTIQASDPICTENVLLDGSIVELQGAIATPALPTSGNPVSTTITWTPDINAIGEHNIVFRAISGCCTESEAWCNLKVVVHGTPKGCTLTPGFWKTHSCSWPDPFNPGAPNPADANHNGYPDNIENQCGTTRRSRWAQCPCDPTTTMLVGSNGYTQCQLLCLLAASSNGNAVRILGIQLTAAKLNKFGGATTTGTVTDPLDPTNPYNGFTVDQLIAEGDSLIGSINAITGTIGKNDPRRTRMIQVGRLLDLYNNGFSGVTHCN